MVTLKGNTRSYEDFKKAVVAELHQQGLSLYKKLVSFFSLFVKSSTIICSRNYNYFRSRSVVKLLPPTLRKPKFLKLAKEIMFLTLFYDLPIVKVKNIDAGLLRENWNFSNFDGATCPLTPNVPFSKSTIWISHRYVCLNFCKLLFRGLLIILCHQVDEETLNHLSSSSDGYIKTSHEYYCVKWTDVLDLVRLRRVYLDRGRAYVSSDDLISVLGAVFRSNLSHTLGVSASSPCVIFS